MLAGRLREVVTLYSRGAATDDAYGQETINWVNEGSARAELVPLRAVEVFAGQQVTAQAQVKFRIRTRPGIDATWRLVWKGVPYDITGVQPFMQDGLDLFCTQGAKDGR